MLLSPNDLLNGPNGRFRLPVERHHDPHDLPWYFSVVAYLSLALLLCWAAAIAMRIT